MATRYNEIGKDIYDALLLRFEPIAIKVLYDRSQTPPECVSPSQNREKIPALCQAYAMVRRNRRSLAIFREDHWCIWPIVSLKLGKMDEQMYENLGDKFFMKDPEISKKHFREKFPRLRSERPIEGLALAPLATCSFEPDVVVIYCDPAQARQLLMGAQFATGEPVHADFDIVGSCMQAIIPILNGDKPYNLAMPDDGEYERSLVLENEMLFAVGREKLEELYTSMKTIQSFGFGHKTLAMDMNLEYPRPEFYNNAMKAWGLKTGPLWGKGR